MVSETRQGRRLQRLVLKREQPRSSLRNPRSAWSHGNCPAALVYPLDVRTSGIELRPLPGSADFPRKKGYLPAFEASMKARDREANSSRSYLSDARASFSLLWEAQPRRVLFSSSPPDSACETPRLRLRGFALFGTCAPVRGEADTHTALGGTRCAVLTEERRANARNKSR